MKKNVCITESLCCKQKLIQHKSTALKYIFFKYTKIKPLTGLTFGALGQDTYEKKAERLTS